MPQTKASFVATPHRRQFSAATCQNRGQVKDSYWQGCHTRMIYSWNIVQFIWSYYDPFPKTILKSSGTSETFFQYESILIWSCSQTNLAIKRDSVFFPIWIFLYFSQKILKSSGTGDMFLQLFESSWSDPFPIFSPKKWNAVPSKVSQPAITHAFFHLIEIGSQAPWMHVDGWNQDPRRWAQTTMLSPAQGYRPSARYDLAKWDIHVRI